MRQVESRHIVDAVRANRARADDAFRLTCVLEERQIDRNRRHSADCARFGREIRLDHDGLVLSHQAPQVMCEVFRYSVRKIGSGWKNLTSANRPDDQKRIRNVGGFGLADPDIAFAAAAITASEAARRKEKQLASPSSTKGLGGC